MRQEQGVSERPARRTFDPHLSTQRNVVPSSDVDINEDALTVIRTLASLSRNRNLAARAIKLICGWQSGGLL